MYLDLGCGRALVGWSDLPVGLVARPERLHAASSLASERKLFFFFRLDDCARSSVMRGVLRIGTVARAPGFLSPELLFSPLLS
jgi:hypothetical protein